MLLILLLTFTVFTGCIKPRQEVKPSVVIHTFEASEITSHSALISGEIVCDDPEFIVARGMIWGATLNPFVYGTWVPLGSGPGSFGLRLENLLPDTNYYFMAFFTGRDSTTGATETHMFTTLE